MTTDAPATLRRLLELEPHGPDTFVGTGLRYPWGGLYGGHIVAQALAAATRTVSDDAAASDDRGGLAVHSLRAYFIRRGDHAEPVRQEVDRIRNGRSFATRRVVARQAVGAILNLEASFQRAEPGDDVQPLAAPHLPSPDGLVDESWSPLFERRPVPIELLGPPTAGTGRLAAWLRVIEDLGEPAGSPLQHVAFAYLSDDLPTVCVTRAHPRYTLAAERAGELFSASLDHTVWFHRPMRADRWHLHDVACHSIGAGRGLAIAQIWDLDGQHVATVAQEVLLRIA